MNCTPVGSGGQAQHHKMLWLLGASHRNMLLSRVPTARPRSGRAGPRPGAGRPRARAGRPQPGRGLSTAAGGLPTERAFHCGRLPRHSRVPPRVPPPPVPPAAGAAASGGQLPTRCVVSGVVAGHVATYRPSAYDRRRRPRFPVTYRLGAFWAGSVWPSTRGIGGWQETAPFLRSGRVRSRRPNPPDGVKSPRGTHRIVAWPEGEGGNLAGRRVEPGAHHPAVRRERRPQDGAMRLDAAPVGAPFREDHPYGDRTRHPAALRRDLRRETPLPVQDASSSWTSTISVLSSMTSRVRVAACQASTSMAPRSP